MMKFRLSDYWGKYVKFEAYGQSHIGYVCTDGENRLFILWRNELIPAEDVAHIQEMR